MEKKFEKIAIGIYRLFFFISSIIAIPIAAMVYIDKIWAYKTLFGPLNNAIWVLIVIFLIVFSIGLFLNWIVLGFCGHKFSKKLKHAAIKIFIFIPVLGVLASTSYFIESNAAKRLKLSYSKKLDNYFDQLWTVNQNGILSLSSTEKYNISDIEADMKSDRLTSEEINILISASKSKIANKKVCEGWSGEIFDKSSFFADLFPDD